MDAPVRTGAASTNEAQPLRVLFHIRHFGVGGIENALMGWLRALDRRDFQIGLSVALPTRELDTIFRTRIPADVTVHWLVPLQHWLVHLHQRRRDGQMGKWERLWFGFAMEAVGRPAIRRALLQIVPAYDLVIDFDLTLRKIARHIRQPLIGFRHFGFWRHLNAKAARVGRAYRNYDCLVVLNEAMRDQAFNLYGKRLPRIEVLPNAFDLEAIRHAAHHGSSEQLPTSPYVVCVARLDIRTKGLDSLLLAWRRTLDLYPDAQSFLLVLVGDGTDKPQLERLVEKYQLQRHVQFAGLQENPYPWIAAAQVLVLSSRTEGMPNVLIEALALETVTVSTDCPVGPREILANGKAGVLVPVGDIDALARALWQAATDQSLRNACLKVARERAERYGLAASNARLRALAHGLVSS